MAHPRHVRSMGAWAAAGLAALGLAGCSMHPLSEDISPASTFDIVERIRCEVLDGLKNLREDPDTVAKIINATAIGYDFDFRIEEKNGERAGTIEYKRAAFKGDNKGFFLELGGQAERERKSIRAFRIVDNLGQLAKERGERCARTITTANGLYPITGATGMGEVVRTYVKLEILSDLAVSDAKGQIFAKGEVFSDELKFTSKLTAGAAPKIELVTVAGQFRLTNASLSAGVNRDDVHSITVALSRGPGDVDMVKTLARKLGVTEKDTDVVPFKGEPLIRPYRTVRRLMESQGFGAETRVIYELERRRGARENGRAVNRILRGTQ